MLYACMFDFVILCCADVYSVCRANCEHIVSEGFETPLSRAHAKKTPKQLRHKEGETELRREWVWVQI